MLGIINIIMDLQRHVKKKKKKKSYSPGKGAETEPPLMGPFGIVHFSSRRSCSAVRCKANRQRAKQDQVRRLESPLLQTPALLFTQPFYQVGGLYETAFNRVSVLKVASKTRITHIFLLFLYLHDKPARNKGEQFRRTSKLI